MNFRIPRDGKVMDPGGASPVVSKDSPASRYTIDPGGVAPLICKDPGRGA